MPNKRKSISKKKRFEIFKRDSFTCQYCGNQAPDVVLNVDHIEPVSKGGTNKLTNLVTSCFDCNSGKSDRELNDDSVIKKQMNQLKENQDRIEQIKMIADWAKSQELMEPEINAVNEILDELNGKALTDEGERWVRRHIKKHGLKCVIECLYTSWDKYADEYLDKFDAVIKYKNASEDEKHWAYSVGILKNRISYYDKNRSGMMLSEAKENGLHKDDFRTFVFQCQNWTEYRTFLEEYTYG